MKKNNNSIITESNRNRIRVFFAMMAGILLCGSMLVGCEKKDNDDDDKIQTNTNEFSFNGEKVKVVGGEQHYYGHYEYYGSDANNIDLYLFSEDLLIAFEMFVPNGKNELVAGTYTKKDTGQAFTFISGGGFTYNDNKDIWELEYEATSANITVAVSDKIYTLNINGVIAGKAFAGNYTGTLDWVDETE